MTQISKQEYEIFRNFLENACGIVLGENKHYLVTSRLNKLIHEFSFPDLASMLVELKKNANNKLKQRVVDAMTTNETMWFRDKYPFEMLNQIMLPELAKGRTKPIRVWSAASSSGQESYSISMTISEYLAKNPGAMKSNVEIIATDISPSMLKIAKDAKYDKLSINRGLTEDRRKRFFKEQGDEWQANSDIRQRVRFTELNLTGNYALLGKFDIIFCRNVLIYFSSELKTDILNRMAKTLNPQGFILLGGSESPTGYCDAFDMVRTPLGVMYRLREGWRASR
ncbi:Chemotaxis protein methyltransferase CheR [hydrothermal vent metagenome]|uniref:protein-glutamate O-methyltransferase n=1 Tax=hydrothermal vent metagenome TaxID=652676 RepID=A0A3B0ZL44_9ZZZZ